MKENIWYPTDLVSKTCEVKLFFQRETLNLVSFYNPAPIIVETFPKKTGNQELTLAVDFIYNYNDSAGPADQDIGNVEGAGFLDGKLIYTGYTQGGFNRNTLHVYKKDEFHGKKVEGISEIRQALKDFYGKNFDKFRRLLHKLPYEADMHHKALGLLINEGRDAEARKDETVSEPAN